MLAAALALTVAMSDSSRLERAKNDYFESRYVEALSLLRVVIEHGQIGPEGLEDARLFAATCQIALSNNTEAKAYLRDILTARPGFTLPKGTSPKVRDVFAEVSAEHIATSQPVPGLAPPSALSARVQTGPPLYTRWWLWTAVGAVVVGGAVTAAVLASRPTTATLTLHVSPPP